MDYKLWDPSYLTDIVLRGHRWKASAQISTDELQAGLSERFRAGRKRLIKVTVNDLDYGPDQLGAALDENRDSAVLAFCPTETESRAAISFLYLSVAGVEIHYPERMVYTGSVAQDVQNLRCLLTWATDLARFLGCREIELGRDGSPLEMVLAEKAAQGELVIRMAEDVHTLCESDLSSVGPSYRSAWTGTIGGS